MKLQAAALHLSSSGWLFYWILHAKKREGQHTFKSRLNYNKSYLSFRFVFIFIVIIKNPRQSGVSLYVISLNRYSLSSTSCHTMDLSEQISSLFTCNVTPSEKPQLDIGVSKREPLNIAVPMTIFYSIIFFFGVWTVTLLDTLHTVAILPSKWHHWYIGIERS